VEKTDPEQISDILTWWFGDPDPAATVPFQMKRWFMGGAAVDDEIRARFGAAVEQARRGALTERWGGSVQGALALLILLDQFSRNIHRGEGASWHADPLAQRVALIARGLGLDLQAGVVQRAFFYLPFEHAEDPLLQQLSLRCFSELHASAPADLRAETEGLLRYALSHKAVVDRFGRYPHRNAPLGRESTKEEREFVAAHGTGF
jgi:uncharacterized protein (DUF924 family)